MKTVSLKAFMLSSVVALSACEGVFDPDQVNVVGHVYDAGGAPMVNYLPVSYDLYATFEFYKNGWYNNVTLRRNIPLTSPTDSFGTFRQLSGDLSFGTYVQDIDTYCTDVCVAWDAFGCAVVVTDCNSYPDTDYVNLEPEDIIDAQAVLTYNLGFSSAQVIGNTQSNYFQNWSTWYQEDNFYLPLYSTIEEAKSSDEFRDHTMRLGAIQHIKTAEEIQSLPKEQMEKLQVAREFIRSKLAKKPASK